jgi:hypothetical protein
VRANSDEEVHSFVKLDAEIKKTNNVFNVLRGVSLALPAVGAVAAGAFGSSALLASGVAAAAVLAGTTLASVWQRNSKNEKVEKLRREGKVGNHQAIRLRRLSEQMVNGYQPS